MVHLKDPTTGELSFNKLDDPDDSLFRKVYKHAFRYAMPNLFVWGPLAPAYDALVPRSLMASAQLGLGLAIFAGTFVRYPASFSTAKRRITRLLCLGVGGEIVVASVKELENSLFPESNPLYIEVKLARQYGPERNNPPTLSSYWFGPANFMPMNNQQYWKMIYSLELNQIMVDEYNSSDLLAKFEALADKYNEKNGINDGILTQRIVDVIKSKAKAPEDYSNYKVDYKLFERPGPNDGRPQVMDRWYKSGPIDALQLAEHKDYINYEFPRLKLEEPVAKK